MGSTQIQEVTEGQGVRRQRKSKPRGSESATHGNRQKRVCREWDSIVRLSSAAAIQGISEKRVCRGGNSMIRRGNEAATQGNRQKKVCRGRDERFFIKMEQISR